MSDRTLPPTGQPSDHSDRRLRHVASKTFLRLSGSRHTTTAARVVYAGLTALGVVGCISFTTTGGQKAQSSAAMKRQLLQSYLFQAGQRFYPRGDPSHPEAFPTLGPAEIKAIQQEFTVQNKWLTQTHDREFARLSRKFGPNLKRKAVSRVEVLNTGKAITQTTQDGVITVDTKVAQALFRGAVVDSDQPSVDFGFELFGGVITRKQERDAFKPSAPIGSEAERKALAGLLQDIDAIKKIKGKGRLGDIGDLLHEFRSEDSSNDAWFNVAEIGMRSGTMQFRYAGASFFLLAHERGHLVLNHYQRLATILAGRRYEDLNATERARYCHAASEFEFEADAYATMLLALQYKYSAHYERTARSSFPDSFSDSNDRFGDSNTIKVTSTGVGLFTGFEPFFSYSYEFGGFLGATGGGGCSYPSVTSRLEACRKLSDPVIDEARASALAKLNGKRR